MANDVIKDIANAVDIPVIATIVSYDDDFKGKIHAGASILNVSAGKNTAELVSRIRKSIGEEFPIIATGGNSDELISKTIEAGANSITYTPPTSAEMFHEIMIKYREEMGDYK